MQLVLGDIVNMATDAVAVPTHPDLRPIPGIREAVFRAADTDRLRTLCSALGGCRIGQAVITPSCGLPCKYLIHVCGPGWYSGRRSERLLYADCYLRALHKAYAHRCRSIALPLMFSGNHHLPRSQALEIVRQVTSAFERTHPDLEIILVLYTESIYRLARKIFETEPNP